MREILFRGKRKDNGEWVYWNIYGEIRTSKGRWAKFTRKTPYGEKYFYHIYEIKQLIDPETVGQYTGLTDKNGKKIFEGDILENFIGQKCAVTYESCYYYPLIAFPEFRCWSTRECAVIGNIHDNPKLLKWE